jgi:RNA polymerase sigma-70 factor (ECF subfamily)
MENRCQLIKKSNPCNCKQWIRFGLSQGWFSKQAAARHRPTNDLQAQEEIIEIRNLRNTYQELYQETAGEPLAQRIRAGIKNEEWAIFS